MHWCWRNCMIHQNIFQLISSRRMCPNMSGTSRSVALVPQSFSLLCLHNNLQPVRQNTRRTVHRSDPHGIVLATNTKYSAVKSKNGSLQVSNPVIIIALTLLTHTKQNLSHSPTPNIFFPSSCSKKRSFCICPWSQNIGYCVLVQAALFCHEQSHICLSTRIPRNRFEFIGWMEHKLTCFWPLTPAAWTSRLFSRSLVESREIRVENSQQWNSKKLPQPIREIGQSDSQALLPGRWRQVCLRG
jgi:hypothetical protein